MAYAYTLASIFNIFTDLDFKNGGLELIVDEKIGAWTISLWNQLN